MLEWLSNDNECPVCKRDFSIEIKKYKLREEKVEKTDRDTSRISPNRKKLTIDNPNAKESYNALKGVSIFFGLILALVPTVVIALLVPFPIVIAVMIVSYIFYFGGMVIFNLARTNYRFYWDKITFSKKGIIVSTSGTSSRTITPEKIKDIKLKISESSDDYNQNKEYHIALEISTGKKLFQFGGISSSKNYEDIQVLSGRIDDQIKKLYSINPSYPSFNINDYLFQNRIFILISGVVFIVLNAILIPIGYFLI